VKRGWNQCTLRRVSIQVVINVIRAAFTKIGATLLKDVTP
jgi:hypothetical protein